LIIFVKIRRMKRYLLVIFGEFDDMSFGQELALSLTPLVESPQLKFQISKGACIFHFESDVEHEEIHEFVQTLIYENELPFILTEMNDKVSVHMNKKTFDHLMDLNSNEGSELKLKYYDNPEEESQGLSFEDQEENMASLLKLIDKSVKPSLDAILDKINEKGYSSLTEYEKEILDGYSKK